MDAADGNPADSHSLPPLLDPLIIDPLPPPPPEPPPPTSIVAAARPLFRVSHHCCRTTRRLRPLPVASEGPAALVGQTVELFGLKSKPDLNGRRGRVVNFTEETGRVGVLLKSIKAFGAVEKSTLALLPANLHVVEASAAKTDEGATTWAVLLDHLGLGHLRTIPWWAHEEVIADALMPQARGLHSRRLHSCRPHPCDPPARQPASRDDADRKFRPDAAPIALTPKGGWHPSRPTHEAPGRPRAFTKSVHQERSTPALDLDEAGTRPADGSG